MYDISLLTRTILSLLDMHAPPSSDQPRTFGHIINTNQSAISQPRRMALTRQTLHAPVCTEETDKEAVAEKKRGGKIMSASLPSARVHGYSIAILLRQLDNQLSNSIAVCYKLAYWRVVRGDKGSGGSKGGRGGVSQ